MKFVGTAWFPLNDLDQHKLDSCYFFIPELVGQMENVRKPVSFTTDPSYSINFWKLVEKDQSWSSGNAKK